MGKHEGNWKKNSYDIAVEGKSNLLYEGNSSKHEIQLINLLDVLKAPIKDQLLLILKTWALDIPTIFGTNNKT